jgi:hypothetical protein
MSGFRSAIPKNDGVQGSLSMAGRNGKKGRKKKSKNIGRPALATYHLPRRNLPSIRRHKITEQPHIKKVSG